MSKDKKASKGKGKKKQDASKKSNAAKIIEGKKAAKAPEAAPKPKKTKVSPESKPKKAKAAPEPTPEQQRLELTRRALDAAEHAQALADEAGIELPSRTVVADGWRLDATGEPSTLSVERQGERIAVLPLPQQTYGQLLGALNSSYILPDDEPLTYQVRVPDLMNVPPVLSLIRGGAVVGSLAMDEEFNANVGDILKDLYRPKPELPARVRFRRWVRKHKFYTALLILLALPVAIVLGQGIFYSVVGSFR